MAPDPASVYSLGLGLPRKNLKSSRGEYAICQLPDGTWIEEWALYYRDHNNCPPVKGVIKKGDLHPYRWHKPSHWFTRKVWYRGPIKWINT